MSMETAEATLDAVAQEGVFRYSIKLLVRQNKRTQAEQKSSFVR